MVMVDEPAGMTGLTLNPTVVPAGWPLALRVTGSVYPRIEPMSTAKTASDGAQTAWDLGVTLIVKSGNNEQFEHTSAKSWSVVSAL